MPATARAGIASEGLATAGSTPIGRDPGCPAGAPDPGTAAEGGVSDGEGRVCMRKRGTCECAPLPPLRSRPSGSATGTAMPVFRPREPGSRPWGWPPPVPHRSDVIPDVRRGRRTPGQQPREEWVSDGEGRVCMRKRGTCECAHPSTAFPAERPGYWQGNAGLSSARAGITSMGFTTAGSTPIGRDPGCPAGAPDSGTAVAGEENR